MLKYNITIKLLKTSYILNFYVLYTIIRSIFAKHLITTNHEYKNKEYDVLTPMHICDKKGSYMNY